MKVTHVTAAQRRPMIGNIVGVVLIVLGILLAPAAVGVYLGGSFAHHYVSSELDRQKIIFPHDMSAEPVTLRPFASQAVNTGPEAKAFAAMIAGHVAKATGGKTFSEVSQAARQNTDDPGLQRARATALEGNMIYGTLQNAYGWWLMGSIAKWTSYGLAAVCLLFLVVGWVLIGRGRTITA